MKKIVILIIVLVGILLSGCSDSKPKQPTQTTASEELSVDTELAQKGYYRDQLTDPALYDYLHKQASGVSNPALVANKDERSKKIGATLTFSKNKKLGISGIAQVSTENKIKINSFNYNGSCGPIAFGLAISGSESKPLAKVKEIPTAQSESAFDLIIPSNISLNQFDTIGIYCPSSNQPVSLASF